MFSTTALSELDELIVDLHKMARRLNSGVASLASSVGGGDTAALRRVGGDLQRLRIEVQRPDIDVDDLNLAMCIGQVRCGRPQRSPLQASTVISTSSASPTASAAVT